MMPAVQYQQLLTAVRDLDDKALATLEDVMRSTIADEEQQIRLLKEKLAQVKELRDAIQKEDAEKIRSVRAQLGLPPTT